MNPNEQKPEDQQNPKEEFPGYPHQPASEDIYRQEHEEEDIDPETGRPKPNPQKLQDHSMDVPGEEDDDAEEAIGSEDEENNYYSLGGDDHQAQEENQGD